MGSVRGFRCGCCRAEFLVMPESGGLIRRTEWTPPVLCCGQPVRVLKPDRILSSMVTHSAVAGCPRCGYEIRLIVPPLVPLICMLCRKDLALTGGNPDQDDQRKAPVAPTPDFSG